LRIRWEAGAGNILDLTRTSETHRTDSSKSPVRSVQRIIITGPMSGVIVPPGQQHIFVG